MHNSILMLDLVVLKVIKRA